MKLLMAAAVPNDAMYLVCNMHGMIAVRAILVIAVDDRSPVLAKEGPVSREPYPISPLCKIPLHIEDTVFRADAELSDTDNS